MKEVTFGLILSVAWGWGAVEGYLGYLWYFCPIFPQRGALSSGVRYPTFGHRVALERVGLSPVLPGRQDGPTGSSSQPCHLPSRPGAGANRDRKLRNKFPLECIGAVAPAFR